MKGSRTRKVWIGIGGAVLLAGLVVVAVPELRSEARSLGACITLARSGLRPVAETPAERFLGKVQDFTAQCRGGPAVLAYRDTPWVDWTHYWGAGDATSLSRVGLLPISRLSRNQRGLDGALLDLEYQRIELIKFNLYDNYTFADYVRGRDAVEGRALRVWPEMRLPPEHPEFESVGGSETQLCTGELIRFRTLTGICNDIRNPLMGSTNTLFARNVQFETTFPELSEDELTRNRHGDRLGLLTPDPQVISRELFTRVQSDPELCNDGFGTAGADPACDYIKAPFFNVIAAFWIQFMTHDWFSHMDEGENAPELMEMGCSTRLEGGVERELTPAEIEALGCRPGDRADRSLYAQTDPPPTFSLNGEERLQRAPRTTANTNTAWWDASQIYGYSEVSAQRVKRDPEDPARLLMVSREDGESALEGDAQGYLPPFEPGDPIHPSWAGQEASAFPDNWSIGLSFLHNVFSREHNAFVDAFRAQAAETPDADSGLRNPADPDRVITYAEVTSEELYEVARLVVAAMIAKIHTIEWTTQLLYDDVLHHAMNSNWSGLFQDNERLSRALERVILDRLGTSFREVDATTWWGVFASGSGIFGLGSRRYEGRPGFRGILSTGEDIWDLRNPDHVNGGVNHFGSPFNFPEEFVTVYRLHPLVPDVLEVRDVSDPNPVRAAVPVVSTFRGEATQAMHDQGLANWAVTMGRQRLGALTLQNHPRFLQNLPMPRFGSETGLLDVAALDLIRDRERGVPRFNEFRRQYGLQSLTSFDDFIDPRLPEDSAERHRQEELVRKMREIYGQHVCDDSKVITSVQLLNGEPITDCLGHPDGTLVDNVEDLDTVVGWLAEPVRPHGFAISETQFTVFILNASRRLFSDRFFTSSFRPEFYTHFGVAWVNDNGPDGRVMEAGLPNGHPQEMAPMKRVLLRTMPELADELDGVVNTFDPWARDRGSHYSLEWTPRPGAESDPAFGAP